jgi:hypothetical protein
MKKGKSLKLDTTPTAIKKEPPEIDLSEPMPPASPTDDPLLLSGPPEEDLTPRRNRHSPISPFKSSHRSSPAVSRSEMHLHPFLRSNSSPFRSFDTTSRTPRGASPSASTLPPSSPIDDELPSDAAQFVPAALSSEESMEMDQPIHSGDYDGPLPVLFDNMADPVSDSDDDDDAENTVGQMRMGEGEYTGKWTDYFVHTQRDPPSSATKTRREIWGNPASPYPISRSLSFSAEETAKKTSKGRLSNVLETNEDELPQPNTEVEAEPEPPVIEQDVLDDSLPASDPPEEAQSSQEVDESLDQEEEDEVREMSMERDIPVEQASDEEEDQEECEVREMSIEIEKPLDELSFEAEVGLHPENHLDPQEVGNTEARHEEPAPEVPSPTIEAESRSAEHSSLPFPKLSRLSAGFPRRIPIQPEAETASPASVGHEVVDHNPFKTPAVPADRVLRTITSLVRPETNTFDEFVDREEALADADASGDSDSEIGADTSVVKITSSDPRAAARAAAILKQASSVNFSYSRKVLTPFVP